MAAKNAESIYKVIEVIGTSSKSWADAGKNAVETASKKLRNLRVAEVVKLDMKVSGKQLTYRALVRLSFKYEH
jgi:dodecin